MQHFFNFQGSVVFGVLAFLGTCFALLVATVTIIYLLATRRHQLSKRILKLTLVGVGLYLGTLLAFSVTSREQLLGLHEEKYFCEVDCHLAYSVINVTKTKTLGSPPNQITAQGVYYIVTVKVRFDEMTISSRRPKNMPLTPNPRTVTIIDEKGKQYATSPEGQRSLEPAQRKSVPLTQPLRPGEIYTTDLVFNLPSEVENPSLLITEADWVTYLLFGHENSFFHKKTKFRLEQKVEPVT